MGFGFVIALVLLMIFGILFLAGVLVLYARTWVRSLAVEGPEYKHDLGQVRYYGQSALSPRQPAHVTETQKNHENPRRRRLPRCVCCWTSAAFENGEYPKCDMELGPPMLRR